VSQEGTLAGKSESQDISRRYAHACFALAREQNQLEQISADLSALQALLVESADLQKFIGNATIRRDEQLKAIAAIGAKAKWSPLTQKFLGTLVQKRRLNMLPSIIEAVLGEIAASKGEITARVTAAQKLDAKQIDGIAAALKKITGKTVKVQVSEDVAIMGGLIINIGSQLIDSSVRSKLERLHRSLKSSNTSQGQKKIREVA
jgi:F-type H+-transporting ATPase subunit delta